LKESVRSLVADDTHTQEMVGVHKEDLKESARSLVADLRNSAFLEGKTMPELNLRFDRLEKKVVADFCGQTVAWYNDNVKYKGAFQGLLSAVLAASTEVHTLLQRAAGAPRATRWWRCTANSTRTSGGRVLPSP
jgi:hypothetical protein